MGVPFMDDLIHGLIHGTSYSGLLFPAVLVSLLGLFGDTMRGQVISLKASACALLVYLKWYFDSLRQWSYFGTAGRSFYCGLWDGSLLDVVVLGAFLFLFVFQLYRLAPYLLAKLGERGYQGQQGR